MRRGTQKKTNLHIIKLLQEQHIELSTHDKKKRKKAKAIE